MGEHRTDDPEDPRRPTSPWWQAQHPPPPVPLSHHERTRVLDQVLPVGLPEDEYDRWASGELPRVPPDVVEQVARRHGWTETQPEPAPRAQGRAPARRPSLAARVVHSASEWIPAACYAVLTLVVLGAAVLWGIDTDRTIDRLARENRDLREVQIEQQRRLNDAETEVEQARSQSAQAEDDVDQLQRRVGLLEQAGTESSGK